jgi:hypothetical protein
MRSSTIPTALKRHEYVVMKDAQGDPIIFQLFTVVAAVHRQSNAKVFFVFVNAREVNEHLPA